MGEGRGVNGVGTNEQCQWHIDNMCLRMCTHWHIHTQNRCLDWTLERVFSSGSRSRAAGESADGDAQWHKRLIWGNSFLFIIVELKFVINILFDNTPLILETHYVWCFMRYFKCCEAPKWASLTKIRSNFMPNFFFVNLKLMLCFFF